MSHDEPNQDGKSGQPNLCERGNADPCCGNGCAADGAAVIDGVLRDRTDAMNDLQTVKRSVGIKDLRDVVEEQSRLEALLAACEIIGEHSKRLDVSDLVDRYAYYILSDVRDDLRKRLDKQ